MAHLGQHKWFFDRDGYVRRSWKEGGRVRNGFLHRIVLGLAPGDGRVDHKSGDKLDCRRENLRVVTHQANMHNRGPLTGWGSSRHRGVTRRKNGWEAAGRLNNRFHYIGLFPTEQEAADAAAAWRRAHMPDALQDAR